MYNAKEKVSTLESTVVSHWAEHLSRLCLNINLGSLCAKSNMTCPESSGSLDRDGLTIYDATQRNGRLGDAENHMQAWPGLLGVVGIRASLDGEEVR